MAMKCSDLMPTLNADIDHYNLSDEIIELINMGAEISDEDI